MVYSDYALHYDRLFPDSHYNLPTYLLAWLEHLPKLCIKIFYIIACNVMSKEHVSDQTACPFGVIFNFHS